MKTKDYIKNFLFDLRSTGVYTAINNLEYALFSKLGEVGEPGISFDDASKTFQEVIIGAVLYETEDVVTRAATYLGVKRTTLQELSKRLQAHIPRDCPEPSRLKRRHLSHKYPRKCRLCNCYMNTNYEEPCPACGNASRKMIRHITEKERFKIKKGRIFLRENVQG